MYLVSARIDISLRQILTLLVIIVMSAMGISGLLLFFSYQNTDHNVVNHQQYLPIQQTVDVYDTITIAVAGDVMCHSTQFNAVFKAGRYDFNEVFTHVKPYFSSADLSFVNLETVTSGEEQQYTGYPQFNSPATILDAMQDAGLNVITNANNHSLDRRFIGVERTIDSLEARGFKHTGTFKNAEDTLKSLIVEAKGIKIAVLAYTYGTNGIPLPVGKEYCVSIMDSARMQRDVERAKQNGADKIAVFIHWGLEYERYPNSRQKNYANYLASLGVDFIFGSHPHVLQPTANIVSGAKSTFVVYSLGNFVSGQRKPFTDYGVIFRVQLIKNKSTGDIRTGKIDFIPTYVSAEKGYQIVPVSEAIRVFESEQTASPLYLPGDMQRMQQIWPEAVKHLTDSSNDVFPYKL